jgi:hypothetical protein
MFTIENVRKAVEVLFIQTTSHTKEELKEAGKYLETFGKSP